MSLYTTHCYLHSNPHTFDLYQIEFIQVSDTDFCGGWLPSKGKYRDIILSFKSGNQLNMIVKEEVCKEIQSEFEKVKSFQSMWMGRWENNK